MNKKTILISSILLILWEVLQFIVTSAFANNASDAVLTNMLTTITMLYMFVLPIVIAFVLKKYTQPIVTPLESVVMLVVALVIRGALNYPRLLPIEQVTATTLFTIFIPTIVLIGILAAASKVLNKPQSH